MKVILKRTLQETLKISAILVVVACGIVGGWVLGSSSVTYGSITYSNYLNELLVRQHMVVFLLLNGVLLMSIAGNVSSGLIVGEVHEGTFRLLVAKPNDRRTILLGKVLGMLTGSVILMVLGVSVMYAVEIMRGAFDGNISIDLLGYMPAYLLYGLFVILFISSLGTLLSTITKKKIIALLPVLAFIILAMAVPVVLRIVNYLRGNTDYSSTAFYFVDFNYHFGSVFKWCVDLCGGIKGTSDTLELPFLFMGLFKPNSIDLDIARQSSEIMLENNTFNAAVVMLVYVALSVVNYIASFAVIKRKDV